METYGDVGWELQADAPFRPSYQGWKPVCFIDVQPEIDHLLDLPIRDGNVKLRFISFRCCYAFRPSYQGWKPDGRENVVIKSANF